MERRRIRQEWVSTDFSSMLSDMQRQVKQNTGRDLSKADITAIMAAIKPAFNFPSNSKKKKDGSVFDF